jgi:predicted metal-dependent hydrolase
MSRKTEKIAAALEPFRGKDLDPHYLGFVDHFNRQLFYEAHDVLEELWLGQRQGPEGAFSKGLIQLAGAFVHLQKNRLRPAAALFKLSRGNLNKYPRIYQRLDLAATLLMIEEWLERLEETDFAANPLDLGIMPKLHLM